MKNKEQRTKNKRHGFSLIEILVVLSIFVIIAVVANQVFFSTLRGGSKSEATSLVRQEGSYAVSVIERALQGSKGIVSCTQTAPQRITYLDSAGSQAYFEFCKDSAVASNSATAKLTTSRVKVSNCSLSCLVESGISTVSASFTVKRAETGLTPREQTQLDFKTRVLLRN